MFTILTFLFTKITRMRNCFSYSIQKKFNNYTIYVFDLKTKKRVVLSNNMAIHHVFRKSSLQVDDSINNIKFIVEKVDSQDIETIVNYLNAKTDLDEVTKTMHSTLESRERVTTTEIDDIAVERSRNLNKINTKIDKAYEDLREILKLCGISDQKLQIRLGSISINDLGKRKLLLKNLAEILTYQGEIRELLNETNDIKSFLETVRDFNVEATKNELIIVLVGLLAHIRKVKKGDSEIVKSLQSYIDLLNGKTKLQHTTEYGDVIAKLKA